MRLPDAKGMPLLDVLDEELEVEAPEPPETERALPWPNHPPTALKFPKGPPGTPGGWLESDPLPKADVVVITWTSDEWKALHDVLAPGLAELAPDDFEGDWRDLWYPYTRNFYKVYQDLWNHRLTQWQRARSMQTPSLNQERGVWYRKGIFGNFCRVTIGDRVVLLFRSCFHLNTDGRMIPLEKLIEQIIEDTNPSLILSVGTSGGVSTKDHLGDVVVTNKALFRLTDEFSDAQFNHYLYTSPWKPPSNLISEAEALMREVEEEELWLPCPHYQKVVSEPIKPEKFSCKIKISEKPIITTDYFEYGTTENNLDEIGCAVEMGDALVAKVCHEHGVPFGFIRNVSDPVINAALHEILQASHAVEIYEKHGYETSWNSAVAVWAVIAGGIEEETEGEEPPEHELNPVYREPAFPPEKEEEWQGLSPVTWEEGEPKPELAPSPDPPESFREFEEYGRFRDWKRWAPLPAADALIFVWTPEVFEALHHVMIGSIDENKESLDEKGRWQEKWEVYNRNSHTIFRELYLQKQLQRDRTDYLSPEGLSSGRRLGRYRVITIGGKSVVLLYSRLSIRTDGATLPMERMVDQALSEVNPELVLSVGTAGAVTEEFELGSVLVTNSARFLLGNEFDGYSLNGEVFGSGWGAPTAYIQAAEKKMKKVEWPEVVAPSVSYKMPEIPIKPSDQEPKIHLVDQPVITAPRRVSTGFFYINLFEIGTTRNNLSLLGCAVDTRDAVVAQQCQEKGIDCGFVRAIAVPIMRIARGKTKVMRSWAQVFEDLCVRDCAYNAAVATWSLIAGDGS